MILACMASLGMSCKNKNEVPQPEEAKPVVQVVPVDVNKEGFDLLENMSGHWIGQNKVLSWEFDWFAFDFRPISSSHVLGIYEGGTMGNLLTSFFVTDYKNTRTIMARNGGVLSGIYRTSYFVLDSVRNDNDGAYYRLVDAKGGASVMYMELRFKDNELFFNAYTSRLGENTMPRRHMTFKGKRGASDLHTQAKTEVDFPKNILAWDFSNGFREDYLYVPDDLKTAKSASFLAERKDNDVYKLAVASGDPFKIKDHPHLATLEVNIERNDSIKDSDLFVYLSEKRLTDENGYMITDSFETVLQFPILTGGENNFLFTYLHPGTYYVTIIADKSGDQIPSLGDITHPSNKIVITPEQNAKIKIRDINVQN